MPALPDLTDKEISAVIAYLGDPGSAHVAPDVLAMLTAPRPPLPSVVDPKETRFWTGYGFMNSSEDLPAINAPWSTLTAYDLNEGTIKWQIPLGTVAELAAKGIKDTGSFWPRGGVVVTAGGLIFSGTKSDSTVRAYDKDTGAILWEKQIPGGPDGVPAVYQLEGREYVVFCAGRPTVPSGGTRTVATDPHAPEVQGYYVFALPSANAGIRAAR